MKASTDYERPVFEPLHRVYIWRCLTCGERFQYDEPGMVTRFGCCGISGEEHNLEDTPDEILLVPQRQVEL